MGNDLYSNLSYMVAGAIAERATGKSWETLMQERLFTPLGMTTVGYGPPATPGGVDQPSGHRRDGTGGWVPVQFGDLPAAGAPAGSNLHMSIQDWAQFISLWFSNKEPAILDRSTLNELSTPESGDPTQPDGSCIGTIGRAGRQFIMLVRPGDGSGDSMDCAGTGIGICGGRQCERFRDPKVQDSLDSIIASFVTNEDLPGGRGPQNAPGPCGSTSPAG